MTTPNQTRAAAFAALHGTFDVLIIGGGATGLGIALDAATRGLRTALVEAGDFAQSTSSRSTKLVHGGVRYLASGQIHLVREALHERAVMLRNAPHLVRPLPTILPAAAWWDLPWFGTGLTAYDKLSGASSMGPTRIMGPALTALLLPGVKAPKGGILYHDAQFNDARYALALARTAIAHGATVLNYVRATRFCYTDGKISGALLRDVDPAVETQAEATCTANLVINAAGIFSDPIRALDQPTRPPLLTVSRGTHIVVPAHFLGGDHALMVPKTVDGRVIFAIPWQGVTVIGTTDLPAPTPAMEPGYTAAEIDYLLDHIRPYLRTPISRADILSIFSGLRPLVTGKENKTSKLSREHHIDASRTGLLTVAGGKWTTYRRMAEDTLNFAIRHKMLRATTCVTANIPLQGSPTAASQPGRHSADQPTANPHSADQPGTDPHPADQPDATPHPADPYLAEYGTDAPAITALAAADPTLAQRLDPTLPYTLAMAVFAIRHEHARSLDDVLSRRTRALLLDAAATLRAAPAVAALLAHELGHNDTWIAHQLATFTHLVQTDYLPTH